MVCSYFAKVLLGAGGSPNITRVSGMAIAWVSGSARENAETRETTAERDTILLFGCESFMGAGEGCPEELMP